MITIREVPQGSITLVELEGRLDATSATAADRRLAALVAQGARQVVLDLAGVEYVSSAGLRVLLAAAKRLQREQGQLVLAQPAPQTRQILDMAGFAALIPVFDTRAGATASLGQPAPPATPARPPLNLAEEVFLLALDDRPGLIKAGLAPVLDCAVAGALLMELALYERIDTDMTALKVVDPTPTGEPLVDEALRELQSRPTPEPTSFWLKALANPARQLQERALAGLLDKGILRQEDRRLLWVFEVRRYPVVDDREVKEVRTRLRELILGDDLPEPRDVVLLNLGLACRLLDDLLPPAEYEQAHARIVALARLDLIGQEMARAIRDIETSLPVMMQCP
jgi:anti-anti-sigma factor